MSDWEKGFWLRDVLLIVILAAATAAYGAIVYFAVLHHSFITIGFSVVAIPFVLASLLLLVLMCPIPFEIVASILRTRVFPKG